MVDNRKEKRKMSARECGGEGMKVQKLEGKPHAQAEAPKQQYHLPNKPEPPHVLQGTISTSEWTKEVINACRKRPSGRNMRRQRKTHLVQIGPDY